jgi:hypothetical protein
MRAWIDVDDSGRQYLTRVGSGLVLSVTPLGDLGAVHRIAILIDGACGPSPAIRFQASAIIATDDPMFAIAMEAIGDEESYSFTIEWHRHEHVPADLPMAALDVARDTRGILVELAPIREYAQSIPNIVPARWSLKAFELNSLDL